MLSLIDTSLSQAKPVLVRAYDRIAITLVGCGGTGSYLAPRLADIAVILGEMGKEVTLRFIDPDIVESGNIPRQNFVDAEIGVPKAVALAYRYGTARRLDIAAISQSFALGHVVGDRSKGILSILVGAVDNAAARQTMTHALGALNDRRPFNDRELALGWYLDCGNALNSGQVLIGCALEKDGMAHTWVVPSVCAALPAPTVQHPELLVALPDEVEMDRLSCAELTRRGEQSLLINHAVAVQAASMLHQLLITLDLRRFATYLDLPSGTMKSTYTSATNLAPFMFVGKKATK